tara:strand:- start:44 stop:1006 length:963 start_codon:yes stop_codon:yes gene_type:complete
MSLKSIKRIQNDIKLYHKSDINTHGIYVHFSEKNLFNAKALIIGPKETPYQNGFYLFDINYTENYPQTPPNVVLCTLSKQTRFNPNLYTNGKVCLSILGTWSGPGWTPCLSTNEVLLSIQSLLNNNPVQNEPGYEQLTLENSEPARTYVNILDYHNHLIAVHQIINKLPHAFECFRERIERLFLELYDENITSIQTRINRTSLNNSTIYLRMYNLRADIQYEHILTEYKRLYSVLSHKYKLIDNQKKSAEEKTVLQSNDNTGSVETEVNSVPSKKRVPNSLASECDVGYTTTSENDGRQYIIKLVKGRGGASHKRWIIYQ